MIRQRLLPDLFLPFFLLIFCMLSVCVRKIYSKKNINIDKIPVARSNSEWYDSIQQK